MPCAGGWHIKRGLPYARSQRHRTPASPLYVTMTTLKTGMYMAVCLITGCILVPHNIITS